MGWGWLEAAKEAEELGLSLAELLLEYFPNLSEEELENLIRKIKKGQIA